MPRKVLVIGAEVFSRIVDWNDRNTCVLFGDGAGAVVLEACEGDHGVLSTHLYADGSQAELLYQPGFGTRMPPSAEAIARGDHFLKMQGNEVFKVAVRNMAEVARIALEANGMTTADVDLFIPHQANIRILDATAKRIGLEGRSGLCQRRSLRQYLGCDDPHRPRRGRPGRPTQ